jgi:hypothetical protein
MRPNPRVALALRAVAQAAHEGRVVPVVALSLRDWMAIAYTEAGIFALESWAEAVKSAEHYGPGDRRNKALARAFMWDVEAKRCERIVAALEAM